MKLHLTHYLRVSARSLSQQLPRFILRHVAQADCNGGDVYGHVEGHAQAAGDPGAAQRGFGTRVSLQRQGELLHAANLLLRSTPLAILTLTLPVIIGRP